MNLISSKILLISNLKLSKHTTTLYRPSATICGVTVSRSSFSKPALFPALFPVLSSVKETEFDSETNSNPADSFRIFH